ncbi:hypothetical protein FAUST_6226 [Fusarium austroamericanum]|uniref:Uncharacterized protein n=1 Tax=Fusarium austroamericanum TaxID=282268 RepID=A0AAN5Z9P2_FUSAU|nr:hypothetical protein FAUST_6226 [Fusarium austroamericanum]
MMPLDLSNRSPPICDLLGNNPKEDNELAGPQKPQTMEDRKTPLELETIRQILREKVSLTPRKLQWLSDHIRIMDNFDDAELETICEIRILSILVAKGTPFTALDEFLAKRKDYHTTVANGKKLRRMASLLGRFDPTPFNPQSWEMNYERLLGKKDTEWLAHVLPHPLHMLVGHGTIQAIAERNSRRLALAKKMGKTIDDLHWDPNDMMVTWHNIKSEVMLAIENRQIPKLIKTAVIPFDPSTNITVPPSNASRFLTLMNGDHILAKDWDPIRKALKAQIPLKLDIAAHTYALYHTLVKGVIEAGLPFWISEPSHKDPNYDAMNHAAHHAARMLVLFSKEDKQDALSTWPDLKDQVRQQDMEVWDAINGASWVLSKPNERHWRYTMWSLHEVYTSKTFLQQVSLLMTLLNYLGSSLMNGLEDSWTPPPETSAA